MKYDLLEPFKDYLYGSLSKNTARKYYSAIVKLLDGINVSKIEMISLEYLEEEILLRFKTRNEFSAAKNALKRLADFYPQLRIPDKSFFESSSVKKRNYTKKPGKIIYLEPTLRKINQLKNEKLKYAYRLALVSGLRVSELADLEKRDLAFTEGKIIVTVRRGKGGHGGTIKCRDDPYLYERLVAFADGKEPEQKLFYGEAKMRREAWRLGFECHDLRRIYAIMTRKELKKQMPAKEADRMAQQNMRHVRFSTTKRYLYNRKLKMDFGGRDEQRKSGN